jgi:serine protease inhibitor
MPSTRSNAVQTSSTPSQLALPRFELEWDATLNDALQDLGIILAFGGGDFTPMSPANPWLDTVVQKTYIRDTPPRQRPTRQLAVNL